MPTPVVRASLLCLFLRVSDALVIASVATSCTISRCRHPQLGANVASSLVAEMAAVLKNNRTPERHCNGLVATILAPQKKRLTEVFTTVDEDADGYISQAELVAAMKLTSDGELAEKADQVWEQTIAERSPTDGNPFHRNFKRDCSGDDPSKIDFDEVYNTYVDQAYITLNPGNDDDAGGSGGNFMSLFEGLLGKKD